MKYGIMRLYLAAYFMAVYEAAPEKMAEVTAVDITGDGLLFFYFKFPGCLCRKTIIVTTVLCSDIPAYRKEN